MIYRRAILVFFKTRNTISQYLYVLLRYLVIFVVEPVFADFVSVHIVLRSCAIPYMRLLFCGGLPGLLMCCLIRFQLFNKPCVKE